MSKAVGSRNKLFKSGSCLETSTPTSTMVIRTIRKNIELKLSQYSRFDYFLFFQLNAVNSLQANRNKLATKMLDVIAGYACDQ